MANQQSPTQNMDSSSHRPPFLRRCSISDPRLDILPHNFVQDQAGFNPFNRVLSGLLEGSAFSLNKGSTESVDKEGHANHNLHSQTARSNHELGSLRSPTSVPTSGGLKKSATSISALFGSSPQHQHFPTIPETEDHGLMMSTRPNASLDAEKTTGKPSSAGEAASSRKSGGFMNMFGGGFLSRPVLHSQEENYRYIMALDR